MYQKKIKTADTKTTTECFSISVPAEFKITSTSNTCQFAAKSGSEISSSNTVLIVPFNDKLDSKEQAVTFLKEGSPNLTDGDISSVKVDGVTAEMFAGSTKVDADHPERLIASYVVYGTNPYTPSGKDYPINAFSIRFAFEPGEVSESEITTIVDSITWK